MYEIEIPVIEFHSSYSFLEKRENIFQSVESEEIWTDWESEGILPKILENEGILPKILENWANFSQFIIFSLIF